MSDFEPKGERMVIHCYFEEEARQHHDYVEEQEALNVELATQQLLEEQLHDTPQSIRL